MRRVERFVEIDAPVERVFEAFSNFESFPKWMSGIAEVRRAGRHLTQWALAVERGRRPLMWETELTIFQPDHRIAWRSVRGDVETDGEAIFEETRRRTTVLRVILGYDLPHARSRESDSAGPLFGRQFERVLESDLSRFKRMIEHREESEQPRRRPIAKRNDKRMMDYREQFNERDLRHRTDEETRRQPRADESYYRETLHMRGRSERERDNSRRPNTEGSRRVEGRPNYEDEKLRRERAFNEALSAARQSQRESMRHYDEDRQQPVPHQAPESARDERLIADRFDKRPRFQEEYSDDDFEVRLPRRSYALNARDERGREEGHTRHEGEEPVSNDPTLRRGADRLLDEPPSGGWRRQKNSDEKK